MQLVLHWSLCAYRKFHKRYFKYQMLLVPLHLCCTANYAAALLLSVTPAVFCEL